ncbi:hypothetical protein GCM10009623_35490 [Nocardioides aestuarii]|uniref:Response regulator transcription factor n=1 Tax=Nocardioides aestuarii TaxID=252231 RepID=A0ABW4TSV2_9ACTN
MAQSKIRVLLVDDHQMVREVIGRTLALQADVEVVGSAGDAYEALALVRAVEPHVVLMDVDMPGLDGIAATAALCAQTPSLRVVMLTATCPPRQVRAAFAAGACGYLLKEGTARELCDGVRTAVSGGRPVSAGVSPDVVP